MGMAAKIGLTRAILWPGEQCNTKTGGRRTDAAQAGKLGVNDGLSEPVLDLVGPVPLEPLQRKVDPGQFAAGDAADLLDCIACLS